MSQMIMYYRDPNQPQTLATLKTNVLSFKIFDKEVSGYMALQELFKDQGLEIHLPKIKMKMSSYGFNCKVWTEVNE